MISVDARRADFEHSNLFFLAVLGAISLSGRMEERLIADGDVPRTAALVTPAVLFDDPALAAVLGAVAIRERLLLHLSAALRRPSGGEVATPGDAPPTLHALLR